MANENTDYKAAWEELIAFMRETRDEYRRQADEDWAEFMEYRGEVALSNHFKNNEAQSALNVCLEVASGALMRATTSAA